MKLLLSMRLIQLTLVDAVRLVAMLSTAHAQGVKIGQTCGIISEDKRFSVLTNNLCRRDKP
jgi:hypothetical protein